ncbi:hypothetical protein [Sphingomonas sp.]
MRRHAALDRLSDITKRRVIRRAVLVPLPIPGIEDGDPTRKTKVEWPVPD